MRREAVLLIGLGLAFCAYAPTAQGLSPWAYYPINEDDFSDHSGHGHHGTAVDGSAAVLDEVRGWVAAFNVQPAKPSRVLCGTEDPSAGGQLSVGVWIRWEGTNGQWQGIAGKSFSYSDRRWIMQLRDSDGMIQWGGADSASLHIFSTVAPGTYQWHHLAGTCDGTTSRIYLDGEIVGEGPGGFSANTAAGANVAFGFGEDRSDYDESFNGALDEIYIFSRALSEPEVKLIMAGLSPELASEPSPGDGAQDVARDAVLTWKPGQFARTHDVYLGTLYDDVNAASRSNPKGLLAGQGQDADANALDPAGLLDFGRTYYWRVDEINAPPDSTVFKGKTWSFTAEKYGYPVKPIKATASSSMTAVMGPEKTIDGSGLDSHDQHSTSATQMWLSKKNQSPIWIRYDFDAVYRLHQMWVWNSNQEVESGVGFGAKDVIVETSLDGTTWTALADVPEFADGTGEPNYTHNTTVDFGGVQAKVVKLTIHSNWADGTKQAGLSEVRFFHVPVKAYQPTPAAGATGVAINAVLNWRPGREAVRHEVCLGTDPNALGLVQTVTSHSLGLGSLGLQYGRTYYWKVNEVNDAATPASWEGNSWSFTTIGYAVVDDFESYDDVCKRIFFSWVDGFGYSGSADCDVSASAGNGTNSTVGNVSAPFAEKAIIHGGRQSMPMAFDNTKSPYYSEAQHQWPTPQSWTGGGVDTLVVYLRGAAASFVETSPGSIIMNGTGSDIWGNADQLRFAHKSLSGNGSIVARVESVSNTDPWAKAGVMIRESLDAGSVQGVVVVTPSSGISFQRRLVTADTSSNTDVTGVAPPYWVKLTRAGTTLTAQCSADGVTWTDIVVSPALTFTMASNVYIGLAVTSHTTTGTVCAARFSHVSTTGGVSGSWQVAEIGLTQVNGNTPETFYVAVQDNAGNTKAVSNPDPSVIATGNWEQWSIPLSQFTSAGVNLSSIKKMIVGVGDRSAPKAGSTGKLYIDDIRLTRVSP